MREYYCIDTVLANVVMKNRVNRGLNAPFSSEEKQISPA